MAGDEKPAGGSDLVLPARSPRVLLVEDVEDNRELARELLEAAGFEVVEAADGLEALQRVSESQVDLILLDLALPVIDGWETLRRLKADQAHAGIPVVALTAHAMAGDRERALGAGCTGYIPKPITVATFANEVRSYLKAPPDA